MPTDFDYKDWKMYFLSDDGKKHAIPDFKTINERIGSLSAHINSITAEKVREYFLLGDEQWVTLTAELHIVIDETCADREWRFE